MADPDFNLLAALDVLLAEGRVAGAARVLGLSNSAMSRTLSRLRAATGDQLLVRAGRLLVATPHATLLRERVTGLAAEVRAVLHPAARELDLSTLERVFTIRANEGFVDAFAARLAGSISEVSTILTFRCCLGRAGRERTGSYGAVDSEQWTFASQAAPVQAPAIRPCYLTSPFHQPA